jgi:pilus assembly protein Flp/PilA
MRAFLSSESGASAVEYGLIMALVAFVIIAAFTFMGRQITGITDIVASSIGVS